MKITINILKEVLVLWLEGQKDYLKTEEDLMCDDGDWACLSLPGGVSWSFLKYHFKTLLRNDDVDNVSAKEFCVIWIFLTLEQIIVLNKYCSYNTPVPKISHVKTLKNCVKWDTNNNKMVRKYFLFWKIDCEASWAWIALKLGRLHSFMIRNAFL